MKTNFFKKHLALLMVFLCSFLMSEFAYSQQTSSNEKKTVSGAVVDENGDPLIGVRVWLKDSAFGTLTDIDGNYRVEYTGNYGFINFSFFGYKTEEVPFQPGKPCNIKMSLLEKELDEIVVVGYGTQKKESVVGAITNVDVQSLKAPVAKISSLLAGNVPGIISYQRSGEPGSGATLRIRGLSTLTNSNPLVLVDGIERDLDLVDAEDIQEISVLKDASATAIYGVRGANGVIIITTRSGEEGKPKISVKSELGIVRPTRLPEMVNSEQWAEMWNEGQGKIVYTPKDMAKYRSGADPDLYPDVNWVDELYKDFSTNQRVNMNVSGGSSTAKYYVGGGFYNENGLFKQDNMNQYNTSVYYRRFNFRANVDLKILKYTNIGVNLATTFEKKNEPGSSGGDIWRYALRTSPNAFPMTFSGTDNMDFTERYFPGPKSGEGFNPYVLLTQSGYVERYWNNAQATFSVKQDFSEYITPGLTANVRFAFDAQNYNRNQRTKTPMQYLASGRDENGKLILIESQPGDPTLKYAEWASGSRKTYLEGTLNYARRFGDHNLGGLFLYQHTEYHKLDTQRGSSSAYSQAALPYRHQGIAGRVTYDYLSKYFFEANFGYNGSENFSPGNRFGFFPSVAGGWLISEESFFKNIKPTIDMLKLRASWGKAGNDQIGGNRRFIYMETIADGYSYTFGKGQDYTEKGYYLSNYPNEHVGWETSTKANVGLDMMLFNKLKVEGNYFYEYRKGIFLQRESIPLYMGVVVDPYVNIARMENQGFDMGIDYKDKIGDLRFNVRGNFTYARNKVLNRDEPNYKYPYQQKAGQANWQQTGYIAMGLFKDQEDIDSWPKQNIGGETLPGDIKYMDLNGDGVVDNYDTKPIGYADIPEIVYGFGFTANWKSWDLGVLFKGVAHVTFSSLKNETSPFSGPNQYESNVLKNVYYNRWTVDNPDPNAKYPRVTRIPNPNNNQSSTFWQVSGDYIRLENIEIGYSFPRKLNDKLRISQFRVYAQGSNLITWSKFKLWDPDLHASGPAVYPPTKVVSFGLSFGF